MWINFGGRKRSLAGWKQLLESVDERLYIIQVIGPPKMREEAENFGSHAEAVIVGDQPKRYDLHGMRRVSH